MLPFKVNDVINSMALTMAVNIDDDGNVDAFSALYGGDDILTFYNLTASIKAGAVETDISWCLGRQ